MTTPLPSQHQTSTTTTTTLMPDHHKHPPRTTAGRPPFSLLSQKLSISLCSLSVTFFILLHINFLHTPLIPSSSSSSSSCAQELESMSKKLQESVTFLPMKDLRFANAPLVGHTWFMSSLNDTREQGEVQYQQYPSHSSKGRILCIKGHDNHDGSWNYYALAHPRFLPENATLVKGLTFVSYNHYDYGNIWHGLSAMVPFVGWHIKEGCALPSRWILYHWGEVRTTMSPWLRTLMGATFGGDDVIIEKFDGGDETVCLEEAVVMRHNEGGMSREKRMEVYDLMRCKARVHCNVDLDRQDGQIGLTLLLRSGGRSFRNDSAVVDIFKRECKKVERCRLRVAYANNLTFCQQVKLMGSTDILVSPHGAQLTNMFLMDRNSSVMEFFPKGWLKLAGVGQFVYHWIASWSGMNHEGAWRDNSGDPCPFSGDDRRCMSIYKNGKIGHNSTYFAEWTSNVLRHVQMRKAKNASNKNKIITKCVC